MARNIRFNYMYRDAGNYKSHGSLIFSNPEKLSIEQVDKRLRKAMIQEQLFVAHQIKVPELFLFYENPLNEDDHCFHEFVECELSAANPNDSYNRTIAEFVVGVANSSKQGWVAFLPFEKLMGSI